MKIITNTRSYITAYIQLKDLIYLELMANNSAFASMYDLSHINPRIEKNPGYLFASECDGGINNDDTLYSFVEFAESSEIDFFKGIDWIIDYNEVRNLSEKEIITMSEQLAVEYENTAVEAYNYFSEEEKVKNASLLLKTKLLEYKYYSLRDILWFKEGRLDIVLPDGVEYPTSYKKYKRIKDRKNNK